MDKQEENDLNLYLFHHLRNGHYSELVSYEPNQENLHALHKYHYHIFNGCAENKIDNINIMPQIKDSRCSRLNKDWEKWLKIFKE